MAYRRFAEIVLDIPLNKKFHYKIPPSFVNQIGIGKRVKVPFRGRTINGYCVGLVNESNVESTKDIIQVVDTKPILNSKMLEVAEWLANFYFCGWGEALETFLPFVVRKGFETKTINVARLCKDGASVKDMISAIKKRAPKQARVLEALAEVDEMTVPELASISECQVASIYRLRDRGLITLEKRQVDDSLFTGKHFKRTYHLQPTKEQDRAIRLIKDMLRERKHSTILLKGVTGSGKTEVYLQAISEAITLGLKAIVLVPEISLTPQTIERFKSRFDRVSVLHSSLTGRQRNNQWWEIKNGKADVVIGARSAVFAPLENLGLIVIDEEHENTFKQDSSPRYNARDVSLVRAEHENALLILGSATPSLESYHNAVIGKYEYVTLTSRIGHKPLPGVHIIDMRHEVYRGKKPSHISKYLELCMKQRLSKKEQVLLFLNRRGFSPFINCRRCGFVLRCKRCDISLTYHKKKNAVICHYCNSDEFVPRECPECCSPGINFLGFGTERIEEEIRTKFPEYELLRMDSDTMKGQYSHEKALCAFRRGDIDILLGTQMIAKGLDFPNVTLVGVISADTILNLPDFRASERTFQLLSQVAGRTGRSIKGGHVIIQTYNPEHYSITYAVSHDYDGFAKKELEYRKQLYYPPYGRLARIVLHGKKDQDVKQRSMNITEKLREAMKLPADIAQSDLQKAEMGILGPAPAPIAKVKDRYRWHLIVKADNFENLHMVLKNIENENRRSKKVQIIIDVDPYMLL
ncbi:MAG: primosomal protein N' [Candidatus Scalindua rubra]|uniref:Replication restart protein PriA n=1 Tax=Candidatus Scalindua rubra TaxID=1872076 RepID=A0A1E3X855_9BACT|nr:MAG: primosomal protein N' [Candidatus Scalindua rubra]